MNLSVKQQALKNAEMFPPEEVLSTAGRTATRDEQVVFDYFDLHAEARAVAIYSATRNEAHAAACYAAIAGTLRRGT